MVETGTGSKRGSKVPDGGASEGNTTSVSHKPSLAGANQDEVSEEIFPELPDIFELVEEENEEEDIERSRQSFRCLQQVLMSSSSLMRHPLYHFPPLEDPGLTTAFYAKKAETYYDDIGVQRYVDLCKKSGICASSRVKMSLSTPELNLRYYGLSKIALKAVLTTLSYNNYVEHLILENNFMDPESCQDISFMLQKNTSITKINMRECRIGKEGAEKLMLGIESSKMLLELDLSFNDLGDEGLARITAAVSENYNLKKINFSHNELGEPSMLSLAAMFADNFTISELDLSWNELNSPVGMKPLMKSLQSNGSLISLNLAWNAITLKEACKPMSAFLKKHGTIKHLDLSNNSLTDAALRLIRTGILKNDSLTSVKLGNNPLTPDEAEVMVKIIIDRSTLLKELDLSNVWVNKSFIPLWNQAKHKGATVKIGGILSNYHIVGPDLKKLSLNRAKVVSMAPKKKKLKRDFGHFLLTLEDEPLSKGKFQEIVEQAKVKLDDDLMLFLSNNFTVVLKKKRKRVDVGEMKAIYMEMYPDTKLPEPDAKKKGKKKK